MDVQVEIRGCYRVQLSAGETGENSKVFRYRHTLLSGKIKFASKRPEGTDPIANHCANVFKLHRKHDHQYSLPK